MRKIIIADTSVLIIFDKMNKLDILRYLYHEIFITPEISNEFNKLLEKTDFRISNNVIQNLLKRNNE